MEFYEWDRKGRTTVSEVYGMFVDPVDRSTIVTYRVDKVPTVPKDDIVSELLLLKAGGRKKKPRDSCGPV